MRPDRARHPLDEVMLCESPWHDSLRLPSQPLPVLVTSRALAVQHRAGAGTSSCAPAPVPDPQRPGVLVHAAPPPHTAPSAPQAPSSPAAASAARQLPDAARAGVGDAWVAASQLSFASCNRLVDALREHTMLAVEGPEADESADSWARRVYAAAAAVTVLRHDNDLALTAAARAAVRAHLARR